MLEESTWSSIPNRNSPMNFTEEVSYKFKIEPRWKLIPEDYAVQCIALMLSFSDAIYGLQNRLTPTQLMFEVEGFTEEQIRQWNEIGD